MTFKNAKKAGVHTDSASYNNGGIVISSPRGNTPEKRLGPKYTEPSPVNKNVNPSNI
jgi:hypothetical protein